MWNSLRQKGNYGQTTKMCRALVLTWQVTWNPNQGLGFLRALPCKGPSGAPAFSARMVLFIFISCNTTSFFLVLKCVCGYLFFLLIIIIPLSSWVSLPTDRLSFLMPLFQSFPLSLPSQAHSYLDFSPSRNSTLGGIRLLRCSHCWIIPLEKV